VQAPLAIPVDVQLLGETATELAGFARAAEQAGIARLWAPELHRSSTIPLAVAAGATERIGLGTGVALAFTRSPMALALEALDLDELSGGRLALGLGAGVRRLNTGWHAVSYDPPVARMRELAGAVRELIRALAEGRDARHEGAIYDIEVHGLRRTAAAARPAVPVWLAAVLPGMTRLAGRIADGFLDHPVTSPEWLRERLLPSLREGAERAGRPLPEVAGALVCAVDDDPVAAGRAAALTVGFYAVVRTYEVMFSEHGFAARLPAIRAAFAAGDADRLAEAVGPDMTRTFAAAGTPAEVRERARAWEGLADRLWATPPHHARTPAEVARSQAGILEAFRARP
jgi:probable F420-dependent oxidoreductase